MLPGDAEFGAGSGGGPVSSDQNHYATGMYSISANQIQFFSRPQLPPVVPAPYVITLLATDLTGMQGLVNVRGGKGVRLTAGPPPLPATADDATNGVELMTGELGKITLQRGLLPVDQKMEMTESAITIDAGVGKVLIQSMTEITLSVANGMTKIKLGPDGVTIEALQIKLSAQLQAEIQGLMNKMTGTAMNQISGGITMIG
jgi:hypothetical protein